MKFGRALLSITLISAGSAFAASQSNSVIDLTVPAAADPAPGAFDESVNFAPNFALNQNDPALSNLFSPTGLSNLCFPTSLAEDLIYLRAYHSPTLDRLRLAGLNGNGTVIDPDTLVRQLTSLCHTDPANGTSSANEIGCVMSVLGEAGYAPGNTRLISPFDNHPLLPIDNRPVALSDIRDVLRGGIPALIELAWFTFNTNLRQWTRNGGHYVTAFGYDYNESWGENELQLKIVNPEHVYDPTRQTAVWDTVTLTRYQPTDGAAMSPPNRPFVLSGPGFDGGTKRGFLGMIIAVDPATGH